VSDWDSYVEANERFARVTAEHYQPGDMVWVHDYQLLLVPGLLRRLIPDARIGLFLHIRFRRLFRPCPARRGCSRECSAPISSASIPGLPAALRHITHRHPGPHHRHRPGPARPEVRLGVFPMGIESASFREQAQDPALDAEAQALRGVASVRILVGVDRLDYTKGIPRRLLAYERMLETHPELRGKVRLVQVAVPSRTGVEAYQDFRALVDGLVGRINGAYGNPRRVPVHYIFRAISPPDQVALTAPWRAHKTERSRYFAPTGTAMYEQPPD
jgi:trehalose 6-phosphate synthase/phosphatase